MNLKEANELVTYLKEKRKEAAEMREFHSEKMEGENTEVDKNYRQKEASRYGMEVSLVDHFIRILEQVEVFR